MAGSTDVHVGRYGWLFLVGGSNGALAQYSRPSTFTPYAIEAWMQLLVAREQRAAAAGARYHHLLVPEKLGVYPELCAPTLEPVVEEAASLALPTAIMRHPMSRVLEHTYVDVRGPLRAMRGAVPMYWKTDSHWTPEGAYVAYEQLCLRLGITPRRDLLERPEVTADIPLDLGAAVVPRLTETFRMRSHVLEARRVFANEVVTFKEGTGRDNDAGLHVGSRVVYENGTPRAAPLRVMLFGDSFAEYRPTLLTGLLAETVERLDFVWSAEVDWDLVAAERPDVVVSELAERFHTTIPVDDGFALQRLERTVLAAAGPAS